ncbi:serine hydrolase domain-containing protein [Amycolatopsis nigrescens]|uniref:serine hydrolase domain-containing protein n=1 Tax=Amycolatopsis nigrescens TaxID=381445 RepID=UPI0003657162|nr:serine hydrolase domain-containing protein [Amycolatopsis nigrescens]
MRAGKIVVAVVVAATALTTTGASAIATSDQAGASTGRFDRPRHGFASPHTVLRDGQPADVGLDPARIADAERFLTEKTRPDGSGHPLFSGAVGLLAHDGVVVDRFATGGAVRYADGAGTELPVDQQLPMRTDTIFDLASISKLFTSIAVLQLVERGQLELAAPVVRYLPEFGVHGKESITVEQLLTHTSGFDADPTPSLWAGYPDIPSRRKAVLDSPLKNPPGSTYLYSDINLMTLGFLVEKVTGATLDAVVRDRITAPLGMTDTGYNPPTAKLDRVAATEFQANPPRSMVRGQVHDENAWSLGGVSGHAGVFSTAGDLAILGQAVLGGGSYAGHRILRESTVRTMLTNHNQAFGEAQGLGFELDRMFYMGGLASPSTAGHTGYTGTTLVIDPESRSIAILLTNRVHPSRNWGSINPAREAWATALARSLAVPPSRGRDAWFSEIGNLGTATLTSRPLATGGGPLDIRYEAFLDTEVTDRLFLEWSNDGSTWQPVPVRAFGRGATEGETPSLSGHGHRSWWHVRATVPAADQVILRWRYSTDKSYTGRGVLLDGLRVLEHGRVVLDGERDPSSLTATGWRPIPR